jgi:hypothetical protein
MNPVLKSYFLSVSNPSWEDGRAGTVLVCYARYIASDGTVTTEQFKDKACYRSSYEKTRDMYQEIRCFFLKMDSSTRRVLSRYQGYKLIAKYISFAYREAAKGNQYLDSSFIEFDARREPDDRLGFLATIIGGNENHE